MSVVGVSDAYVRAQVGTEILLVDLAREWDLSPTRRRALLRNALRVLPPERRVPLVGTLAELGERWVAAVMGADVDGTAADVARALDGVARDARDAVLAATAMAVRGYWRIVPPAPEYAAVS